MIIVDLNLGKDIVPLRAHHMMMIVVIIIIIILMWWWWWCTRRNGGCEFLLLYTSTTTTKSMVVVLLSCGLFFMMVLSTLPSRVTLIVEDILGNNVAMMMIVLLAIPVASVITCLHLFLHHRNCYRPQQQQQRDLCIVVLTRKISCNNRKKRRPVHGLHHHPCYSRRIFNYPRVASSSSFQLLFLFIMVLNILLTTTNSFGIMSTIMSIIPPTTTRQRMQPVASECCLLFGVICTCDDGHSGRKQHRHYQSFSTFSCARHHSTGGSALLQTPPHHDKSTSASESDLDVVTSNSTSVLVAPASTTITTIRPSMKIVTSRRITDWVVENLEENDLNDETILLTSTEIMVINSTMSSNSITTYSTRKAGENDTIPEHGLWFGGSTTSHDVQICILPAGLNGTTASTTSSRMTNQVETTLESSDDHQHELLQLQTQEKMRQSSQQPTDSCITMNYNQHDPFMNINTDQYATPRVVHTIKLLLGRNGWGTGVHPTTRLCLEWLCEVFTTQARTTTTSTASVAAGTGTDATATSLSTEVQPIDPSNPSSLLSSSSSPFQLPRNNNQNCNEVTMLDYGCGSGILSIAALKLGATRCIGVDIEAEALITAQRNVELNSPYPASNEENDGTNDESSTKSSFSVPIPTTRYLFEPYHVREVLPYWLQPRAHLAVANILLGPLIRSSMVVALTSNIQPNGLICFSGIRPNQVNTLKAAYQDYVDFDIYDDDDDPMKQSFFYAELNSTNTPGSLNSYGFDCGTWCRVVGRRRQARAQQRNCSDDSNDELWGGYDFTREELDRLSELAVS